jgi:hypothetical protein
MKTLLRIAAGLSFLFFFIGGCCILSYTLGSPAKDAFMITAVGFFFYRHSVFCWSDASGRR